MQRRTNSTTTILNELNSSAKNFLGGLVVLSLPDVTLAGAPSAQPQGVTLDSIYFYDPTHTALYQLIVNSKSYASDLIGLVRDGLCGADAEGSFPTVNFEKIGEWGWNNLATLLGAVNQEVKQAFETCLIENISQRADKQAEAAENLGKFFGLLLLGVIVLSVSVIAACCFYDHRQTAKWQKEYDRNNRAGLETQKLLAQMEEGQVPTYGTYGPGKSNKK